MRILYTFTCIPHLKINFFFPYLYHFIHKKTITTNDHSYCNIVSDFLKYKLQNNNFIIPDIKTHTHTKYNFTDDLGQCYFIALADYIINLKAPSRHHVRCIAVLTTVFRRPQQQVPVPNAWSRRLCQHFLAIAGQSEILRAILRVTDDPSVPDSEA